MVASVEADQDGPGTSGGLSGADLLSYLGDVSVIAILFFLNVASQFIAREKRRSFSKRLTRLVRTKMQKAFGWKALDELTSPEAEDRWRILACFIPLTLASSGLVIGLLDGELWLAASQLLLSGVFPVVIWTLPRSTVQFLIHLISFHQSLNLWVGHRYFVTTMAGKRAILNRAFVVFLAVCELDQIVFQMFSMELIFLLKGGLSSPYAFLSTKVLIFSLLPLCIFGMRDYLMSSRLLETVTESTQKHFLGAVSIPLITMGISFGTGATCTDTNARIYLARLVGVIQLALFILTGFVAPQRIDSLFGEESTWLLVMDDIPESARIPSSSSNLKHYLFLATCMIGFAMDQQVIVIASCIIVFFVRDSPSWSRVVILSYHGLVVLMIVAYDNSHGVALVLLTTARIALAFERRRLSNVLCDTSSIGAMMLLLVGDEAVIPTLTFLTLVTSAVAVAVAQSRLHSASLLSKERQSYAFLAHAVKQKFISVGSTLEDLMQDVHQIYACMSGDACGVLQGALNECRQGERLCLVIQAGMVVTPRPSVADACHKQYRDLAKTLEGWNSSGVLCVPTHGLTFKEGWSERTKVELLCNWDVLRLIVCTWAYKARGLSVSVAMHQDSHRIKITMDRVGGRKVGIQCKDVACMVLTQVIEATFFGENTLVILSNDVKLEPAFSRPRASSTEQGSFPSGLVVGILDDNALVRRNVDKICRSFLCAKPFAMGETQEECEQFVSLLIERNVAMAIIDENLEYDTVHLSGTELARQARKQGFKGCILLHSANDPEGQTLDPCLDGYLQKSVARHDFIRGITAAFENHLNLAIK